MGNLSRDLGELSDRIEEEDEAEEDEEEETANNIAGGREVIRKEFERYCDVRDENGEI